MISNDLHKPLEHFSGFLRILRWHQVVANLFNLLVFLASMVPKLVIDGYNVLFQSQLVGKGRGPQWLSAARSRLVRMLEGQIAAEDILLSQLVFDAPQFGTAPGPQVLPSGLLVVYATNHEEADDLIEEVIRQHPTPKQLRVVSSDLRIQRCARARRAQTIGAQEFLSQLVRKQPTRGVESDSSADAEQPLSESEVAFWLKEFEDLSENP